jgi:TolB-like protein
VGGLLALVAIGGGAAAWQRAAAHRADATDDGLSPRRIAVLYFEDLSRNGALAPVADGLTEELITQLSTVQGLDVVVAQRVAAFRTPGSRPTAWRVRSRRTLLRARRTVNDGRG